MPPGLRTDKKGGLILTKEDTTSATICGNPRHPRAGGSGECKLSNDQKIKLQLKGGSAGDGGASFLEKETARNFGYDYQPNVYSLKFDFGNGLALSHSIGFYGYREDNESIGLEEFLGGGLRLTYDLPYKPQIVASDDEKLGKLDCSAFLHYAPRFFNVNVGGTDEHKKYAGLNCGFKPNDKLSLRANFNFFPDGTQQQPWDPDFTYSLLYKFSDRLSFELSNYAGTRWPWNKRPGQSDGWEGHSGKFKYKRNF
ncbi:hypothetical protein [Jiella mangrovi]|uniref:Uncharacterized protein n=1 Tax=Jiella mangrovi TaxID=2821407 RepID=A0ABS4BIG5_9HYPH|nr:hypothetical protein [Jiella mangrovi]MBP0616486.1 hypothetical protein [Jiella mangrovi]